MLTFVMSLNFAEAYPQSGRFDATIFRTSLETGLSSRWDDSEADRLISIGYNVAIESDGETTGFKRCWQVCVTSIGIVYLDNPAIRSSRWQLQQITSICQCIAKSGGVHRSFDP